MDEFDIILRCQSQSRSETVKNYLDHALYYLSNPGYEGQGTDHFSEGAGDNKHSADWILELAKEEASEPKQEADTVAQ